MLYKIYLLALFATAAYAGNLNRVNNGRIINGTNADPGEYPMMVSMKYFGSHSCGGSILNNRWVLTAAHCVDGRTPGPTTILSGTTQLNALGTNHPTDLLIKHESYDPVSLLNDIALIRISTPNGFVFDQYTQATRLPPRQNYETPANKSAVLIGWGYNVTNGVVMENLQEVNYWVVDDATCDAAHTNVVYASNICAYNWPNGYAGQCSGDSGGPLFAEGYQVGIVSWSVKPCTTPPYPGVLTQVSYFLDWINATIAANPWNP